MNLAFSEQGNGGKIPLILIHAFPLHRGMWKYQLKGLSQNVRILAPDLPGFGESPMLKNNPGMDSYAEAIQGFLAEKGIGKAVFGGCSMGGYILFELWRRCHELVAGLILCDTRAEADTPENRAIRMEAIDNVRQKGVAFFGEGMLDKLLSSNTRQKLPEKINEIWDMINSNSQEGIIHALWALATRCDSRETLSTINVPTLLLVGDDDILTPPTLAQSMQAGIPESRLEVIANAGHLSPFEQPATTNEKILDFLQGNQLL